MASRTQSRRALRDQNDRAEEIEQEDDADTDESEPAEPKVKKARTRKTGAEKPAKVKAAAKPRAPRAKKVKVPPRMIARWAVCDGGLKRLAMFEYKDKAGAETRLAQYQEQKKGVFVLQLVKEVYDPPVVLEPVVAV